MLPGLQWPLWDRSRLMRAGGLVVAVLGMIGAPVTLAAQPATPTQSYVLTMQDPYARTIGPGSRKQVVVQQVENTVMINGQRLDDASTDDGIVAAAEGVFLVHQFVGNACPNVYRIVSAHYPVWPAPFVSPQFGTCDEFRSVSFDGQGGITVEFSNGQSASLRNGQCHSGVRSF